MRDKVLAALATFAEGGSCRRAREMQGISSGAFYKIVNNDADIERQYREIQASRADMSVDRMHELAEEIAEPLEETVEKIIAAKAEGLTDAQIEALMRPRDPRCVRVAMDGLRAAAELYDRRRYGQRVAIEGDVKVSLVEAIEQGRQRALRPPCDPALITDAEYTVIPSAYEQQTSDKQSAAPEIASAVEPIDPFAP